MIRLGDHLWFHLHGAKVWLSIWCPTLLSRKTIRMSQSSIGRHRRREKKKNTLGKGSRSFELSGDCLHWLQPSRKKTLVIDSLQEPTGEITINLKQVEDQVLNNCFLRLGRLHGASVRRLSAEKIYRLIPVGPDELIPIGPRWFPRALFLVLLATASERQTSIRSMMIIPQLGETSPIRIPNQ